MWTLMLLVLLGAAASPACPIFTCNSTLPLDICMLETADSIQVRPCGSGEICSFETTGNSTCLPAPPVELYPGDYCADNAICTTGLCVSGICANAGTDNNCTDVFDCSPGQYCNISSLVCEPQRQTGQSCLMEYDCQNDETCIFGLCVGYLSLPIGAPVDYAEDMATGLTLACSSGFSAIIAGKRVCATAPHSIAVPQQCTPGSLCSDSSGTFTTECICGYNGAGFCSLFPGDPPVVQMLIDLRSILTFNSQCNTFSRFRFTCFAESLIGQRSIFNQFQAAFALITEGIYPLVASVQGQSCLEQALLPDYLEQSIVASEVVSPTCIPYSCLDPNEWNSTQCVWYEITLSAYQYSEPTYFLSPCGNSTDLCAIPHSTNGTCEEPVATRFSGDYCDSHMECLSSNCTSGICQGFMQGEACVNIYDCNPGAYCDSETQKCAMQKGEGMICNSEYDCQNNLGCSNGVCRQYFSLDNGVTTNSIAQDGWTLVCASGYAFGGACTDPPKSLKQPGGNCTLGTSCYSTLVEVSQPCTCSYSASGNNYCPLFPGDSLPQQALSNLKLLVPFNQICGSYSRLSEWCFVRIPSALKPFYAYMSGMMNYTLWAEMQDYEECFYETLAVDYYRAAVYSHLYDKPQPTPDNDEHPSGAHTLLVAFGALVALA